eukprot:UN20755
MLFWNNCFKNTHMLKRQFFSNCCRNQLFPMGGTLWGFVEFRLITLIFDRSSLYDFSSKFAKNQPFSIGVTL